MADDSEQPIDAALPENVERAIADLHVLTPEARDLAIQDLCARYPRHRDEIEALAALEDLALAPPGFPEIDGFTILRKLGHGGMGEVYLADQITPVRRRVALKIIRLGMATATVLSRFENERQALAVMNHETIAKVFDAGTTKAGQPFFAMEFVEGEPLHRYCDRHGLDHRERIRLVQQVCAGVEHAHQKGVIHRDLKPNNILVTGNGVEHRVKIIDFGLARATSADEGGSGDSPGEPLTLAGQLLGTPEYMSPEQARGELALIDTRTDVYAVGAILYFLLTKQLVVELPEGRRPGVTEVLAFHERGAPLPRTLTGDLLWIVSRAIATEPERRYPSVMALADDLERHLNHEPVVAGPPSSIYRARKLVRRYRVQFTTAALVLVTALVGAIVAWNNATEANTNLARWQRLADALTLEQLVREARTLWPAVPERIEDLEDWLRRARQLHATATDHRRALAELRSSALPFDDKARQIDSERKAAKIARLLELDHELGVKMPRDDRPDIARQLERMRAERARLQAAIDRRTTWLFADERQLFRHEQLTALVDDLDRFGSVSADTKDVTIPGVERRLELAMKLAKLAKQADYQSAWQALIADVGRADSRYQGLQVTPMPGLLPLGIDEHSGLWELYHTESGTKPTWRGTPLGTGHVELHPDSGAEGLVLVLIPAGSFRMGAVPARRNRPARLPNVDRFALPTEAPVHDVTLDAYLIGKFEVTQGQWSRLFDNNPSFYSVGAVVGEYTITKRDPVTKVNWAECDEACRRWGLTLPTEARWEHACRAGTTSAYFTGDTALGLVGYANLADNNSKRKGDSSISTAPGFVDDFFVHGATGSLKPNPFGLYDMLGNVREWCLEEFLEYPLWPTTQPGDGRRGLWPLAPRELGVVRGGSFTDHPRFARCARRAYSDLDARAANQGFRVCRSLR